LTIIWCINSKFLHLICSVLASSSLMVHRVEILDQLVPEPFCMRKMGDRYQIYAILSNIFYIVDLLKYCSWLLCFFSSSSIDFVKDWAIKQITLLSIALWFWDWNKRSIKDLGTSVCKETPTLLSIRFMFYYRVCIIILYIFFKSPFA